MNEWLKNSKWVPAGAAAVGGTALGTTGAAVGSSVGIAALGTAVAGTWPLLLAGAVAGAAIGGLGTYAWQAKRRLDGKMTAPDTKGTER